MTDRFKSVTFNETLHEARRRRGLSWRAVALEAGLVPSTVYRIARGAMPDLPNFAALVDWMGLSADEFLTSESRPRIEVAMGDGQRVHLDLPGSAASTLGPRELEMLRNTFALMAQNIAEAKAAANSAA